MATAPRGIGAMIDKPVGGAAIAGIVESRLGGEFVANVPAAAGIPQAATGALVLPESDIVMK